MVKSGTSCRVLAKLVDTSVVCIVCYPTDTALLATIAIVCYPTDPTDCVLSN